MTLRGWIEVGFAAALLTAVGCSSNGGSGSSAPGFVCSDGGAAGSNGVTMTCGGATAATTEQVDVVMGGPASGSTTLRGLNFDVVYDPAKLGFMPAASYTSPLFPGALIAVALYNGQPGRVVVTIQQTGGTPDVAVASGQHDVLKLTFQGAAGVNFSPTPVVFANPEATTPSASVSFASALALSYQ